MIDLDKLEELAKAATPGPWNWTNGLEDQEASLESPGEDGYVLCAYGLHTEGYVDVGLADAAFIAAANPAVVLALLTEHRAALARIARIEALEPTWPRGMYGAPQDMFSRGDLKRALTEGENDGG